MLERAIAFLLANPGPQTLDAIRRAVGIALRSQYRLSEQLDADPRIVRLSGRTFEVRS
jgi:hypothetical protein